jgi:hypothetical protein
MTELLRPEILAPPHSLLARMIAVGIGCGVAGAIVAIAATAPISQTIPPVVAMETEASVRMPIFVATPAPEPSRASEFLFVFRVGGATYVKLTGIEADQDGTKALPAHGTLQLVQDEDGTAVVGSVKDADVPGPYRAYRGRQLRVDRGCSANVVGFAVVSRLEGDPDYAGVDAPSWTADSAMRSGDTVLAARITGCTTGVYARDAALPAIVTLQTIDDDNLADAARSALLASEPAVETQREWQELGQEGKWYDHSELTTNVMRHPTTGVTWVTVHGNYAEGGCGGPDANVWGLFKVGRDGALETVDVRKLEAIHSIEKIIDVEGDGELELVGRPWIGLDIVLVRANGEAEVATLKRPFYGCPC